MKKQFITILISISCSTTLCAQSSEFLKKNTSLEGHEREFLCDEAFAALYDGELGVVASLMEYCPEDDQKFLSNEIDFLYREHGGSGISN